MRARNALAPAPAAARCLRAAPLRPPRAGPRPCAALREPQEPREPKQQQQQQQWTEAPLRRLRRALARGGAADAFPPWDAGALERLYDLDPELMDGTPPELVEIMVVVVGTYTGLMVLYLWLAAWIEEEPDGAAGGQQSHFDDASAQQQQQQQQAPKPPPPQQQPAPPPAAPSGSLPRYAHASRAPPRYDLVASEAPDEGADGSDGLEGVKAALSGHAAEYVAAMVRECGSVVRRKLYLRRLAAQELAKLPPSAAASGGGGGKAPLGLALTLGRPGALEPLVDECLDNMPPELLAEGGEESVVRGISGVVARRLAAAEAGELVRCMQAAVKARREAAAAAAQAEMW